MRKTDSKICRVGALSILVMVAVSPLGRGARWSWAQIEGPQGSPQVTAVQAFFKGVPVRELVSGTRANKYRVHVMGSGFADGAVVVINGQTARTSFVSDTELISKLLPGVTAAPGEISIQVRNPDGATSNALSLDVITDSSVLSINSISPSSGAVSTTVTLKGVGFTATGNQVNIRALDPPTRPEGVVVNLPSADGNTISFVIPGAMCPRCVYSTPPCEVPCFSVTAGSYRLSVTNANGISNGASFTVTGTGGPMVGTWGGPGIRMDVTDTRTNILTQCYAGSIEQAFIPDSGGHFDFGGTVTTEVGPAAITHPARFTGSTDGKSMTLTVTAVDSGQSLGTYALMLGLNTFFAACV